ncbi:MAG: class I SAM-dependent methyltransferase [Myxococcales bacterium]|nr:class I SAM-dependent methyltransferase [Myxococcales bacterium]
MSTSRFFDAIAGRYERAYALGADESRRRMARVLHELPRPPALVLDLGVGTGRELPALLDAGHDVIGVDLSLEMLERCRRRARPIELVHADFWRPLDLASSSFDACVALHGTLAHPPDEGALGRLAREVVRLVRPAGVWVIEVPSPAWLEKAADLPRSAEGEIVRTGPATFTFVDRVVGASIDGRVLSEEEWRTSLDDAWSVRVHPLGALEWLILARPRQPDPAAVLG